MKKNGGQAKEFFAKLKRICSWPIITKTKPKANELFRIKAIYHLTSGKSIISSRLVIKGFMAAFFFTIVILASLVWYTWWSNRHSKTLETTHFRLLQLSGQIIHADEVLTMSAHMAVETGQPQWEQRYRTFEPQLDSAIKEVIELSPEQFMKEVISRTNMTNIKLVAIENRAFDLIHQGDRQTAIKILNSPEYEKQKQIYSSSIHEISNAIGIREQTRIKNEQRIALTTAALLIVTVPLVVFIWFTALRILRKYILERKRAELALRMGEQRFRAIADYTYFWEVWVSPGGNPVWTNPAVERVTGYSVNELMAMRDYPMALVYEEDRDKVDEAFKSALKGSTGREMEFRLLRKDGNIVWVEIAWQPIFDEKGLSQGHRVSIHDIMNRKQTEESLLKSKERFRELFENMSSGVAVYEVVNEGNDFIFKDFNTAAEKIEKIDRKKVIGKSVAEVFPQVKGFGIFDVFTRVWKTGKPECFPIGEYEDNRISGWRENYVYKLPSGEIVAVYDDITERKQAQEGLLESEQRFRDFFENAPIGFHIFGPDQTIIDINDAELEMIGYQKNEIVDKKTWAELIVPQQRDLFKKHWLNIITKGHIRNLEYTLVHKDGHHVNVILNASARFDKDGNIVNTRGSVLDITARKEADNQLRQSEERYRTLVENIDLGITLIDVDHNIVMANSSVGKLFNCDISELVGKKCYNKFEKKQEICSHCPGEKALKNGQVEDVETEGIRDDGSHFSIRIQAFPLFAEGGEPTGFVEVVEDITERKITERALKMIVEASSAVVGPLFFRSLVKALSYALGLKYAFVGELTSKQLRSVQVLAVWANNDFADNFEYNLAGTPCENVIERKMCFHTNNAQERFPQDVLLKELGVESYFGVPLFDTFEQPLGLLAVMHSEPVEDISKIESILKIFAARASSELERIRTERELTNLAKFPSENPNPVLRISGDGTILHHNKAAAALLDISQCQEADIVIKHLHKYVSQTLKLLKPLQSEITCNGKVYSLTFTPITDSDYVNVYGLDITERKGAEQKLNKERDFSDTLIQSSPIFFVAINAEGKTMMMNQAMLKALGYKKDEVVGTDYTKVFVPEYEHQMISKIFEKLVESHGTTLNENKVLTKDGRELLVEWRGRPVFKVNGDFDYFFGVGIDITDRKLAEQARQKLNKELEVKNKELESILYAASHDLKSPLVNIQGFGYELSQSCDVIRSAIATKGKATDLEKAVEIALNKDIPEALNFILASTTKMDLLLSGLLDLCRLNTVGTNIKVIDMNAMMLNIAASMEYQTKQAAAKVDLDPLPPCVGDPSQINRVFSNLS